MAGRGSSRASWWIPVAVFLAALAVYALTAVSFGKTGSPDTAYYDRLAEAFLSGRLHLEAPPDTEDLTLHEGRWYVAFPPAPALLLAPWVAVFGVEGTSTVWFSCLLGALGVVLVYLLLDSLAGRGWTRLGMRDNLWLTGLYAVGSVHWYMAPSGEVWFTAQVCAAAFLAMAAYAAASSGNAWVTGAALAVAMGARPHIVLAFPLLVGIVVERFRDDDGEIPVRRVLAWCFKVAVPVLGAVLAMAAYNWARFGNPLDAGYAGMNVSEPFLAEIREHGLFSPVYVLRNLWAMLLAIPLLNEDGGIVPDPRGMSILLTTPALAYLVRAGFSRPLILGAWIGVAAVLVPLMTYNSTGYWQFGYRFSLDFMVPVMVLLATAAGDRISRPMRGLILLGVLVNLWGVRWWY